MWFWEEGRHLNNQPLLPNALRLTDMNGKVACTPEHVPQRLTLPSAGCASSTPDPPGIQEGEALLRLCFAVVEVKQLPSNLLGSESKILILRALEMDAMSLPLSAQGSVLALTQRNRKGVEMWENFQNSLTVQKTLTDKVAGHSQTLYSRAKGATFPSPRAHSKGWYKG